MAYKDLLKDTSEIKEDGNYFLLTVTDLSPAETYPIQFRWKYKDKTFSEWSSSKKLITPGESGIAIPKVSLTDPKTFTVDNGKIIVYWDGKDSSNNNIESIIDRVNVYIEDDANTFGIGPTAFLKEKGSVSIPVPAGTYTAFLRSVTTRGALSNASTEVELTVTDSSKVEAPTNPNGFTVTRILGGLELSWAGTYANGTFAGFRAIEIFVGNSATATSGTFISAGVLTGDKVINKIVIPVDGTYCRYNLPVYIHARAININGDLGTLQQNVANNSLGAKSAVSADLADEIITNAKLVADSVTATKIATGAITGTKIADDAITSPKIFAGAITSAKIDALAITSEKIAADAITATKIKAGEIDVTKLSAGTISVNNLEAGNISSTSFIRAGTSSSARVEISSSAVAGTNVLAGLHIYDSAGTAILSAPLTGGLTITGTVNATGGSFGSTSTKWTINDYGIVATGSALIDMGTTGVLELGDFSLNASGTTLVLAESGTTRKILETDNAGSNGRIFLGYEDGVTSRQVQVRKSAQVAGEPATNSGGLRNMYTISEGNFSEASIGSYYQSVENGAVLLVWDQNSNV
jgi:hypothetical protein